MPPFILDLPASYHDDTGHARATDFRGREAVTAKQRFCMNNAQVFGDRTDWRAQPLKSFQLRMMDVPFRLTFQDGLCEEAFTPQGYETARIQIFWMKRPEAHMRSVSYFCLAMTFAANFL